LKLVVIAVGQRMPAWVDAGFQEYVRRMPREAPVRLVEVKPEPRGEATPVERLTEAEARRIRSALPAGCLRVVLDERGRGSTTRELSRRLESWQMDGRDVAFVIGGPDGLAPVLVREAEWLWSLSPLTLPHGLVRVIVAEQLYRAWSVTQNHPYHRE
jgi:23S rRNA (pseudouridine1915-N3)-methyltransferase